jgi:arsenate reductase-like glutaredoxin family protein
MDFMYYYDDMEVDKSQSGFTKVPPMNDRTHLIAYKMKTALTSLLHKAVSLSDAKSDLYGEVGDIDVKVLMHSLPSKLLMNTAKLFGASIKGTVDENTIIDIVAYSFYIYRIVSVEHYRNIDQILNNAYNIIHQRHYEYNSADLVYDRLSMSDIASMVHIKAMRIKNLFNILDKTKDDMDIEKVKHSVSDSIYDLMIYTTMAFLKLHHM